MWTFVLTISLLCWGTDSQPQFSGTVTCRDNNNAEVDWWGNTKLRWNASVSDSILTASLVNLRFIIYKAPAVKSRRMNGLRYIYIDSNGATETPNNKLINDPSGILANTLEPLFTPIRQMVRWSSWLDSSRNGVMLGGHDLPTQANPSLSSPFAAANLRIHQLQRSTSRQQCRSDVWPQQRWTCTRAHGHGWLSAILKANTTTSWQSGAQLSKNLKKFEGYDGTKSCPKEPFQCPTAARGHKTQSLSQKRENNSVLWLFDVEPRTMFRCWERRSC